MIGRMLLAGALALASLGGAVAQEIEGKGITALAAELRAGTTSSAALVAAYRARIAAIDAAGPRVNAVIALNPNAAADAEALDTERQLGRLRGPLHGIPILVKDNIETADPMPTTAGSLALAGNVTRRDAPIVARLRAAGAIILGKTNLSEWANIRSAHAISGWSGIAGQTRNPYALDRSPCGSSSGSGSAVAASLAPAALGTETDGSITCPASLAGLVGIKPTVGLLSRTHVVPISHSQDTPGPMARDVADMALLLTVMTGADADDPATAEADAHAQDFSRALDAGSLRGKTIAVARFLAGYHPATDAVFEQALDRLRAGGATLVDAPKLEQIDAIGAAELTVLLSELKTDLNAYLAGLPDSHGPRTLADVIAFNAAHAERELGLFGQDLFERAEATGGTADDAYRAALADSQRLAGPEGLARILRETGAVAVVAPTGGPAWVVDAVNGDHVLGGATTLAAVARAPHISVPMGTVDGLPVGLSIFGARWSEATLIGLAYAFEQSGPRVPPPDFRTTIDIGPRAALFAPASRHGEHP